MLAMDESECVCPLCCEELDISDRQFFPCKCGYQVCMWCWHRIRESESGLCPACRTPYGDDPHEFSAVDVEEVLKANKEKEAAAKRERVKLQHQQQQQPLQLSQQQQQHLQSGLASSSDGDGDGSHSGSAARGPMDVPKDRTQLANMRVIRRNLVYAVGLPPSIASEDTLRKPEYFGQYGKIAKIVLNRSQTTGDPRRASASAYVTFAHKEDTLSCILALDGFYLDGRNIRASYGTSKYCSAFIKNVRCNNPECTYLHEMGDMEDTFTKQEIQAGYVTSGRDVLARQQQIVAQALSAASIGGPPRRRVGGGGPTGTGKASASPVFPPPTFDEPFKASTINLVPPPTGIPRSGTAGMISTPVPVGTKMIRSATAGQATAGQAPASTGSVKSISSAQGSLLVSSRKGVIGSTPITSNFSSQGATAASVVAGVHTSNGVAPEPPPPHTTLTPLTPLKRGHQKSATKLLSSVEADLAMPLPKGLMAAEHTSDSGRNVEMSGKLSSLRNGSKATLRSSQGATGTAPTSPSSSVSSSSCPPNGRLASLEGTDTTQSVGGSLLPGPASRYDAQSSVDSERVGFVGRDPGSLASSGERDELLGGATIGGVAVGGLGLTTSLGGEIFTGPLQSSGPVTVIGSGKDKWNSTSIGGTTIGHGAGLGVGGGLWNDNPAFPLAAPKPAGSSAGVIGGRAPGPFANHGGAVGGQPILSRNPGSSALASMLGINLPTGSGSLHESTSFWGTPSTSQDPRFGPSFNAAPLAQGVIGPGTKSNSDLIGGVTIGRNTSFGREPAMNSNNSDIALLQSLLPGVHITTGNLQPAPTTGFGAFSHDWGTTSSGGMTSHMIGFGESFGGPTHGETSNWGNKGLQSTHTVGAGPIGQRNRQTPKAEQGTNTTIW